VPPVTSPHSRRQNRTRTQRGSNQSPSIDAIASNLACHLKKDHRGLGDRLFFPIAVWVVAVSLFFLFPSTDDERYPNYHNLTMTPTWVDKQCTARTQTQRIPCDHGCNFFLQFTELLEFFIPFGSLRLLVVLQVRMRVVDGDIGRTSRTSTTVVGCGRTTQWHCEERSVVDNFIPKLVMPYGVLVAFLSTTICLIYYRPNGKSV